MIVVPVHTVSVLLFEFTEVSIGLMACPEIARSTGLDYKFNLGAVAQLGERLICIQEVAGSIPTSSTSFWKPTGPVAQLARAHP